MNLANSSNPASPSRRPRPRAVAGRAGRLVVAFTLVEMLICVGAVTLIAIGLGKLFSSTGQTLKVGKQVSNFTEMAATLERQIRADLASATREGTLVIRNKLITNGTAGILLSADDRNTAPRKRRADELVFFASGKFTSSREPQWPGRAPLGSAARIYYGHGMRAAKYDGLPMLDADPIFKPIAGIQWPQGLGQPAPTGSKNPNQYASDWILLRHVTALVRPQPTESRDPSTYDPSAASVPFPNYLKGTRWVDGVTQVGLQPASASIFRFDPLHPNEPDLEGYGYEERKGATLPPTRRLPTPSPSDLARQNETAIWPSFASGIVDLASIDLPTVRTRVLGVPGRLPWETSLRTLPPKMYTTQPSAAAMHSSANYTDSTIRNTFNSLHIMKMMMASTLPGNDPWIFSGGAICTPDEPRAATAEQRMLCAVLPPDFTGNLSGTPYSKDEPYRQQDQAMLAASNLAVGCTEFIVEWSFGDVFPDNPTASGLDARVGSLIWHGYPRPAAGVGPYRGQQFTVSGPAPYQQYGYDAVGQGWADTDGTRHGRLLLPELIHWPASVATKKLANESVPLYSFFGYLDPTFDKTVSAKPPETIDWPWPKFLRFTISLADPSDPNVEQTFQFVVDLPTAHSAQ